MKTFPSVSSSTHKRMMAAAASLAIAGAIGFGAYATGTTPVLADAVRVQTAQMPGFADLVERVTPAVVSVKVKAKVQSTADDGSDDQNGFDNLPDNPQLRRFFKEFRGFGDQNGDLLSVIPFLILTVLLYLVGREIILRTRKAGGTG